MSEATKRNLRPESLTLIQLDDLETAIINNDFLSKEFLLTAIRMARKQRSVTPSESGKYCAWLQDVDGIYHTGCGHTFFFDTGSAQENGAKFCQYCGHDLMAKQYEEEPTNDC